MRRYELMMIFPVEEDQFKAGVDGVKATLTEFGVEIEKEEPFGERELYYEIKKRNRGRFLLFFIKANPAKIVEVDQRFKLNDGLLKSLFVRVDE
jgi:small subunit ribosomal protein S6